MWSSRLWFLVSLIALGALAGGALTALPGLRDASLAQAHADTAAQVAARLDGALAAELADRRATARIAARHPALAELRGLLGGELPEHLRASVVAQQLKKVSKAHARYGMVLVDAAGQPQVLGATRDGIAQGVATAAPVKAAAPGKLGVGLLDQRWIVAAQLPGEPRWVLALSTPSPAGSVHALYADAKLPQQLVVFASGAAVGDAPKALVDAAQPLSPGQSGAAPLDGVPHVVARYPLAAAPGLDFALAWPAVQPVDALAEAGGPGGLLRHLFEGGLLGWLVLGVAALLGLVGILWQWGHVRGATRRLEGDLQVMAGGDALAPVDPVTLPGWLKGVAEAANDAATGARRLGMGVATGARLADRNAEHATRSVPPAAASVDDSVDVGPEASADASADRSADQSADQSSERSAERSSETSAATSTDSVDVSADRSGERAAAPSAEISAVDSADAVASADRSTDRREPPSEPAPAAERRVPAPPSSAPPAPPRITDSVDASMDASLDDGAARDGGVGTVEQPRPRLVRRTPTPAPRPDVSGRAVSEDAPTRQRLPQDAAQRPARPPAADSIDGSVFEMPAVRPLAVDDEPDPEPDVLSDADIRVPQDTGRPRPARASGLLAQLQAQSALEPEQAAPSIPPPPAPSGETTQVRPMPIGLFAERPESTAVGPPPEAPISPDEATFQAVFEQFVATKRECGELDEVDYERFRAKLIRTRKTLMARFDCKDVRFRVYVKAGKAALRAAPILED